jgi:ATP-dependent Lon protease
MLISGSEVTAPKLFVNNSANGRIGLVGYWDCICFDEFAGKDKRVDKTLVDIMKNYMANRSFSRGIEQLTAEASMVFMGNTQKSVAYMLKHSHFFEPLPDKYIDSAFLDRMHAYNPGWEVAPIRHELFSHGYGFVVDYIAEVLKHLRTEDFTGAYKQHFEVASEVSTRDQTGFEKTFSGLMKIIYPDGKASSGEVEELLSFAMEARRRVREHIVRIDGTFARNDFAYRSVSDGSTVVVRTPEEVQYPAFAEPKGAGHNDDEVGLSTPPIGGEANANATAHGLPTPPVEPQSSHLVIRENTKGWSYKRIFAQYLRGAKWIAIRDPYIRHFSQVRNLMEFLQTVYELVEEGDEVVVNLVTQSDLESRDKQADMLNAVVKSFAGSRIIFSWELDQSSGFHARSVSTNHGWKITLDRGLDLFQRYDGGPFALEPNIQETRLTRGAEITYLREVMPPAAANL